MFFGAAILWVTVALLWHPDGDDEIPPPLTLPWEAWLIRQARRLHFTGDSRRAR